MANVKFLSGEISSLPSSLSEGSLYFAITDETGKRGKIIFDKDSLNRYMMSTTPAETIAFGLCSSDINEQEKIIVLQNNNEWIPQAGSSLFVKFEHTNSAKDPSFTVKYSNQDNILFQIPIFYDSEKITDQGINRAGYAGYIIHYMYDGEKFWFMGWSGASKNYEVATSSNFGLVKPWYSHTAASIGPVFGEDDIAVQINEISSVEGRYYALEIDSEGRGFVNVPWEKPISIKNPYPLTIGTYVYDGSEAVTIPIYNGE